MSAPGEAATSRGRGQHLLGGPDVAQATRRPKHLDVDDSLRDELPLLPFAASLARRLPSLCVYEHSLPAITGGGHVWFDEKGAIIALDRDGIATFGETM